MLVKKDKPAAPLFPASNIKKGGSSLLLFLLAVTAPAFSQVPFLDTLQAKFAAYNKEVSPEKLFVQTDKSFYLTGETGWFKIYTVHAGDHQPLGISKVAYVELLNSDTKPVLQTKVLLEGGEGDGSLTLPSSLNSGNYILRAYTGWMKNGNADFFFQKTIQIINTTKRPDWQSLDKKEAYAVQFFPEGGNLVYGIKSRVGFKVVDQYGKGMDGDGVVVNGRNDTAARFGTLKFGMGSFDFLPQTPGNYKAFVRLRNGKTIPAALPSIFDEGYVLHVTDENKEQVRITVTSGSKGSGPVVYLLAHTGQQLKVALAKELVDGKAEWIMNRSDLGEGISNLTLFDAARQPVCERLYFKRPLQKMNIDIAADAEQYGLRSKVNLTLSAHNEPGGPVNGNLSLSVFLLDSLQETEQGTIDNYLWLTSDLKGTVEQPAYYFKSDSNETAAALDNLLLTQGWRRFRWEDMLTGTKPSFSYVPDYEGVTIRAKVTDKTSGSPAAGVLCYLSVAGEKFHLSNAVSDGNGKLTFVANDIYGPAELVVQANNADPRFRIDLLNSFSENYASTVLPYFGLSRQWREQLGARHLGVQASSYFATSGHTFVLPVKSDTSVFYGKPDKRYMLDEFTRFPTMEEVMREFVAEVRLRKDKNEFYYEVVNTPYQVRFTSNPLVLFDGVPVFDLNKIIAFDPLKVKKIEVVARKYFFGNTVQNGIVSYTTYDGNLANFELDANAVIVEYNGLQLKREFYAPVYDTPESLRPHQPDARNVLLWAPQITTGEGGKKVLSFYTSDVPGRYAVMVQGIDGLGRAGSNFIIITTKK